MISRFARSLVASAFALICTAASGAELIVNGNFETTGPGDTAVGWTSTAVVHAFPASRYAQAACCGGFGTYANGSIAGFGSGQGVGGSLSQSFATLAGASYTLSFLYGAFGAVNPLLQQMQVSLFNGASTTAFQTLVVSAYGTPDLSKMVVPFSTTFNALSGATRLTFKDISASSINTDGVLDNVSVTGPAVVVAPVPEPSTYALMLAGLAVMGFIGRRRITASH